MLKKNHILLYFLLFLIIPIESQAFWGSCKFMDEEPKPAWVEPGYEKRGYYVGVGLAEERDSVEKQKADSEQNALGNLAQNISVRIESSIRQEMKEGSGGAVDESFEKEISVSSHVSAKELLRGVKVKDQWLDRKKCMLWTLTEISRTSVEKVKTELIMKNKLAFFNELLEKGSDRKKERDVKRRRKYLGDGKMLLAEIDFSYLPAESSRRYYESKLEKALSRINATLGKSKGRTVIAALKSEDSLPDSVVSRILDWARKKEGKADRLVSACHDSGECIRIASERGFSRLMLVKVMTSRGTSAMGAIKGTLTVEYTLFDVETRKVLSGPKSSFAQVIGWSEEEINWNMAAEKIISNGRVAGN